MRQATAVADSVNNIEVAGIANATESDPSVSIKCLGECVGTFILVLFGCGAVHASVLTGALSGLWQVAVVWGVAIMLACYIVGAVSGAHINPAITFAFAVWGRFSWRLVGPYVVAQLLGAFLAAATLFAIFNPYLTAREQEKGVIRGQPGSEVTAMCYGEYFPNPGPLSTRPGPYSPEAHERLNTLVSEPAAFFSEALGTLILAMVVFAVTDQRNRAAPPTGLGPVFIGLTISGLIAFIAPLTQACFNPARDFGPRLFACLAGWGSVAIPGPRGTGVLTVYILAPIIGAVVGAGFYKRLLSSSTERGTTIKETAHMQATKVILVGGFLGAGKTTLIAAATERLAGQGKRVGLITNDQAANLVDTAILQDRRLPIQEVGGGCFCCRFEDLKGAMDRLVQADRPDVLIGEPVGSCTDLSATVLQPLKQFHSDQYQLAPFSVLVDGRQVRDTVRNPEMPRFPENVRYIYRKQLEEADVIVLNKADLVLSDELAKLEDFLSLEFPQAPVMTISALEGTGVDRWLDYVMGSSLSGRTIAEVDYDEYAEGEAALGWLNAAIRLQGKAGANWRGFCARLIKAMQEEFQRLSAEIAHLKLHLTAGNGTLAANLTGNQDQPSIRGMIEGSPQEARLLVNVRARIAPTPLRRLTETCVQDVAGTTIRLEIQDIRSFAPARPEPVHRFKSVV